MGTLLIIFRLVLFEDEVHIQKLCTTKPQLQSYQLCTFAKHYSLAIRNNISILGS